MKKYILLLMMFSVLLSPIGVYGATMMTITPNTFDNPTGQEEATLNGNIDEGEVFCTYTPNGQAQDYIDISWNVVFPTTDILENSLSGCESGCPVGEWHYLVLPDSVNCPTAGSYETLLPTALSSGLFLTITNGGPVENTNTISDITNTSELAFAGAMGFEYEEVTTWSGNLIKMIIGGGLAGLSYLMPWIIALLVIGVIVGFIYRGFRFFRH